MVWYFDFLLEFNFSWVVGLICIEEQLRCLGSVLYIYGYQYCNCLCNVDGVIYFLYCMGYFKEWECGYVSVDVIKFVCVWCDDIGFCLQMVVIMLLFVDSQLLF